MRFFPARLVSSTSLVTVLLLSVVVSGCGKQQEGERCGDADNATNNDDCADGLTCKAKGDLLNNQANRCCYPGDRVTDSRCEPSNGASQAASQGMGGAANSSPGSSAGAAGEDG
ncbi:MAG TPA: hypothetical protein VFK05_37090 [Polyangiaceae bacterium]|nr:hypothetical protein [Polyangiaceae bacterium]